VLAQDGFTSWRVRLPAKLEFPSDDPPPGVGQCAQFSAPDPSALASDQSLNGVNRTLTLGLTIPRSLNTLIAREDSMLSADLWRHCYSRTAVFALIDHAFASTRMTVKIAVTTNPNGGKGFSWGTKADARHYAADCPILFDAWPTLNDRTMLVWLNAHNGTYIKPFSPGPPPEADFHTS
jgi:hypothetical protein